MSKKRCDYENRECPYFCASYSKSDNCENDNWCDCEDGCYMKDIDLNAYSSIYTCKECKKELPNTYNACHMFAIDYTEHYCMDAIDKYNNRNYNEKDNVK